MAGRKDDGDLESQRIIRRVGQESEPSMAQRVRSHMAGEDADQNDRAEVWGTRLGRALGLALLIYLLYWLISFTSTGM